MATIDFRHPHKTTQVDAQARAARLLAGFAEEKRELIKGIRWTDATHAVADGRGFEGRFEVTDSEIVVAIDLSLLVRAFKGKVETRLRDKLAAEFPG